MFPLLPLINIAEDRLFYTLYKFQKLPLPGLQCYCYFVPAALEMTDLLETCLKALRIAQEKGWMYTGFYQLFDHQIGQELF